MDDKAGFEHHMLKEIMEQPEALRTTLKGRLQAESGKVQLDGISLSDEELRKIEHIVIIGCGTAYHAGLLASYYIGELVSGVSVEVAIASELAYKSFSVPKNSLALVVSQSGETADTLACLRALKQHDVRSLGVVNVMDSTIAREVDGGVYVHVGPERSIASTKAFTSQVAAMLMLGLSLAQAKGQNPEKVQQFVGELGALPAEIEKVLKDHQAEARTLAEQYAKKDHAFYLGRNTLFPIALEGALKLKEVSYLHAEGYPGGELKHGPIALLDERFFEVFLLEDGPLFEKSLDNIDDIMAKGGETIAVTDSEAEIGASQVVRIKTDLKLLTPLLFNLVLQLLAYYISLARGLDVDSPRNLTKSVMVE